MIEQTERRKDPRVPGRATRVWALVSTIGVLVLGSWAFFLPESFFIQFPVSGAHWVSTLGQFNEHLMRDYGSAQVGLGVIGTLIASRSNAESLVAVMAGYVVFAVLHLGYHLTAFGHFTPGSAAAQAVALAAFIVVPLGVILSIKTRYGTRTIS